MKIALSVPQTALLATLAACWTSTLIPTAEASETDSFTYRSVALDPEFAPINAPLNQITNARIRDALINSGPIPCEERARLEQTVAKAVGDIYVAGVSLMFGAVEKDLNSGKSPFYVDPQNGTQLPLPVVQTPNSEHIYNVFDLLGEKGFLTSGRLMEFVTMKFVDGRGQPLVIGSDKTAHFFSQGLEYMEVYRKQLTLLNGTSMDPAYVRRMGLRLALDHGVHTEIHQYGYGFDSTIAGTGIFSYADLAANYAGLHFWFRLTQENMELAPVGFLESFRNGEMQTPAHATPYFQCGPEANVWNMTRDFEWEDYVNAAWDETINANVFRTTRMQEKFRERIAALANEGRLPSAELPMEVEECESLKDYAPRAHMELMLNPKCMELIYGEQISEAPL